MRGPLCLALLTVLALPTPRPAAAAESIVSQTSFLEFPAMLVGLAVLAYAFVMTLVRSVRAYPFNIARDDERDVIVTEQTRHLAWDLLTSALVLFLLAIAGLGHGVEMLLGLIGEVIVIAAMFVAGISAAGRAARLMAIRRGVSGDDPTTMGGDRGESSAQDQGHYSGITWLGGGTGGGVAGWSGGGGSGGSGDGGGGGGSGGDGSS